MVLAAPVAHRAAEAALEKSLQVGEIGVSAGLRYHLDRAIRCREELFHGVELLARDRLVDRLAAELLEPEVRETARNAERLRDVIHTYALDGVLSDELECARQEMARWR